MSQRDLIAEYWNNKPTAWAANLELVGAIDAALKYAIADAYLAGQRAAFERAAVRALGVCFEDPETIAGEIGHPPVCHSEQIATAIRALTPEPPPA